MSYCIGIVVLIDYNNYNKAPLFQRAGEIYYAMQASIKPNII